MRNLVDRYRAWRNRRHVARLTRTAAEIIVLLEQRPDYRERFRKALFDGGTAGKTPGFARTR